MKIFSSFNLLNSIVKSALLLVFLILIPISLVAQDTIKVQTLKFSDITNRRYTWTFPDGTDTYRKILMYYSLKCDRQTAQDIFDCGEWDYLAYVNVMKHTGVMDSTLNNVPHYNWGSGFPDTLRYLKTPTFSSKIIKNKKVISDVIVSEKEYVIGTGTGEITLANKPTKLQFLITKDYIKANSLGNKTLNRLKFNVKTPGILVKNLLIRYILSSKTTLDKFEVISSNTIYKGDKLFDKDGWNSIDLSVPIKTNNFQAVILEISYDSLNFGDNMILSADSSESCVKTDEGDGYLEFDGRYDYVDCGKITELNGVQKFTVEMKMALNSWRNYGYFFRMDNLEFRTAEEYNQPRRYYWTSSDSAGYGIMVGGSVDFTGKWNHFALVYDGTLGQYDGRLKFYINGSETNCFIRGAFPDSLPTTERMLTLIANNSNMNCNMEEFRIWNTALTKDLIIQWMDTIVDEAHPYYDKLVTYYTMDNIENNILEDESGNGHNAKLIGAPVQRNFNTSDLMKFYKNEALQPQIALAEGVYTTETQDVFDTVKIENSPMTLLTYELDGKKTKITDIQYVWEPGLYYTLDENGNKVDSMMFSSTDTLKNDTLKYYSNPFEILDNWEIARYITPYGKGLNLGENGFTWVYDVTDYASLLKGNVDLSAGNQQELIDLRFDFIKGTPPRHILKIDQPWGAFGSYSFASLANNQSYPPKKTALLKDAKQFMFRARLTGHGERNKYQGDEHNQHPHCCEWLDNTHYLFVNGLQKSEWHIWRNFECGLNPLWPQGGNWPGQREGWCPGDLVYNYDFEITKDVASDSVLLDYNISPVPAEDDQMGAGDYIVSGQLFEYSDYSYEVDAEIYDVFAPNNASYFSRKAPECLGPIVVIRNNGREPLTSLNFKYSVSGGKEENYNWSGNLLSMTKDTINLPISNSEFYIGDGKNIFNVSIDNPNGLVDQYSDNDKFNANFEIPDFYQNNIEIRYKTNNYPGTYTYQIRDMQGNIVFEKDRSSLTASTLYKDKIILPDGCYTLTFTHDYELGLWFPLSQYWIDYLGVGSLSIYDNSGKLLKVFDPFFGIGIIYSFDLGGVLFVKDPGFDYLISVFPNPAENDISVKIDYNIGSATLRIYDFEGREILKDKVFINGEFSKKYTTNNLVNGVYYINIYNDKINITNKFIKR